MTDNKISNMTSAIQPAPVSPGGLSGFTSIDEVRDRQRAAPKKRLGAHEVRVGVYQPTKSQRHTSCRITFGTGVMAKMRWQRGDLIEVLFNDEYIFLRRSNEGQYAIQERLNKPTGKRQHPLVSFPIYKGMPLQTIPKNIRSAAVDTLYQDDGILIAWPKPESGIPY